ncbi:MAG: hypothetical protein KME42_20005 [Tildeniella nuda ZEHNDER 1965/U140]|nr:hypothetical protein [Tildeniella nuda ZEHNDER 1965/U140]
MLERDYSAQLLELSCAGTRTHLYLAATAVLEGRSIASFRYLALIECNFNRGENALVEPCDRAFQLT